MPSRVVTWLLVGGVAFVSLAGGGCSSDDDDNASPSASTSSSSSPSSSLSTTSTSASSSSSSPATSSASASTSTTAVSSITLRPDGFDAGVQRHTYSGGATVSTLKDAFRPRLGEPLKEADLDCDAGKLHQVRWKQIDVYFADGRLAGWGLSPPRATPPLVTAAGIGLGSTRGDIERAYPNVKVDETSLGTEWFVPGPTADSGLSGIFSSADAGAVNEALWSGRTCIAR